METCVSVLVSCFLLLRRFDLDVRVFVLCFTMGSWMPITGFSLAGSSGGASGHGVRFDGTVISKGGSIIHLHNLQANDQIAWRRGQAGETDLRHQSSKQNTHNQL